jgi:flagellar export protein FliJ
VKAYRFRLDSVLRVRRLQERVAAQQLAVAVNALQDARTQYAGARRSLEELAPPTGRVTGDAVEWAHAQSGRLSEATQRRANNVEAAEETARLARHAWGTASRRTATLDRLDERHLALWRSAFDRSEAAVLDDLATRRMTGDMGAP